LDTQFCPRCNRSGTVIVGATSTPGKTGLQGSFDFTLNWSPIGQVQGPQAEVGAPPNTGAAPDPTGALSLQDAVRRQLGIRLEDTKLPVPVLVIDSISEKPLDN